LIFAVLLWLVGQQCPVGPKMRSVKNRLFTVVCLLWLTIRIPALMRRYAASASPGRPDGPCGHTPVTS
jgi:hypothetical protein